MEQEKAAAKKERAEAKEAAKQAREAAKAAQDAADDYDPPPPKPTLEDCGGDEDLYRAESELWQIELDERAAQKILDNPKYSLMVRDNANRKLRQCAERRRELCPTTPNETASDESLWRSCTSPSSRATRKAHQRMRKKRDAGWKCIVGRARKNGPNSNRNVPKSGSVIRKRGTTMLSAARK